MAPYTRAHPHPHPRAHITSHMAGKLCPSPSPVVLGLLPPFFPFFLLLRTGIAEARRRLASARVRPADGVDGPKPGRLAEDDVRRRDGGYVLFWYVCAFVLRNCGCRAEEEEAHYGCPFASAASLALCWLLGLPFAAGFTALSRRLRPLRGPRVHESYSLLRSWRIRRTMLSSRFFRCLLVCLS